MAGLIGCKRGKGLKQSIVMTFFALVTIGFSHFVFSSSADSSSYSRQEVSSAWQQKNWLQWVESRHPDLDCPWGVSAVNHRKKANKNRVCEWINALNIDLKKSGLSFMQSVDVYGSEAIIALPGDDKNWPVSVTIDNKPAVIVEKNRKPYVSLKKGSYEIRGRFNWEKRPSSIVIPRGIGFISLEKNNKPQPVTLKNNRLVIAQSDLQQTKEVRDSIKVDVYRLIGDGIPVTLNTQVVVSVTGRVREVDLGKAIPAGAEIVRIDSSLPVRVNKQGVLRAQLKPGEHRIEIISRLTDRLDTFPFQIQTKPWPSSELVSFVSDTRIREVSLSGAISVDTSLFDIPEDWRHYPTYRLVEGSQLKIETLERGDNAKRGNQLRIDRNIWLDFDGNGATVLDSISGQMHKDWRLNAHSDTQIGRATVGQKPVLVTEDGEHQGVEIRTDEVKLKAVSLMDSTESFNAVGWDTRVDNYRARIHLPPGWRVLHASGVDGIKQTWVHQWDLWDIFWVMILLSASYRLLGVKLAGLMAATLLFTYHESSSPVGFWVFILVLIALLPHIKGGFKRFCSRLGAVSTAIFVLAFIGFAVSSFRLAIYPVLERSSVGYYDSQSLSSFSSDKLSRARQAKKNMEGQSYAAEDSLQLEEIVVTARKATEPLEAINRASYPSDEDKFSYQIDQKDRVQTGPGLPTWKWRSLYIHSSGVVGADQTLSITYSKPLFTSIWRVLNVLLIGLLGFMLIHKFFTLAEFTAINDEGYDSDNGPENNDLNTKNAGKSLSVLAPLIILFGALGTSPDLQAAEEYPPSYLLKELEQRLTKEPVCLPHCVSLNNGLITAGKETLKVEFSANAIVDSAVAVPSGSKSWNPDSVTVNGKPVPVKRVGGVLHILLESGHHQVVLRGKLAGDRVNISLPLAIHNLNAKSDDWLIDGLIDGRAVSGAINLSAKPNFSSSSSNNEDRKKPQKKTLSPEPVKPFVLVKRIFELGKKWRLRTEVYRVAPTTEPFSLPIKLLSEERVLSDNIESQKGVANAQFARGQYQVTWISSIEETYQLKLIAESSPTYFETWQVSPSSMWRIDYEGIPTIKSDEFSQSLHPLWKPWPGEIVNLSIRRPKGVAGVVNTVESASLTYRAGVKIQESVLDLSIRASQGDLYQFDLPEGAEIISVSRDEESLNIPSENRVAVQLYPGIQKIKVVFQQHKTLGFLSETPQVVLPGGATNIKLTYDLPRDRWLLFLDGPALGAAMLYWGVLIVIVLGAIALSQLAKQLNFNLPVTLVGWLLLGLGLSTINAYGVLVLAVFFFLMAYRNEHIQPQAMSRRWFNSLQVLLAFVTLVTVITLISAIPEGLLSSPNMKVVGNGSYSYHFNYYQDRAVETDFPTVQVVSLPLMFYRIVMLAWSLWLATRILQWGHWWFKAYTSGGTWIRKNSSEV